jgi:phosphopantetheine--protein transferase-like protein
MVNCAVLPAGAVGIDVVEIDTCEPDAALLAAACTADELSRINEQPAGRRAFEFARLWALKEAAAKGTGHSRRVRCRALRIYI